MGNNKNKKVSDIQRIIDEKIKAESGVNKDEKQQTPEVKEPEKTDVPVEIDNSSGLNLSGYNDFFKKNDVTEIYTTIRVDKKKYEVLKRLSIVHKLPVQVIFDNIVKFWLDSYNEQVQKDLKKLSKI